MAEAMNRIVGDFDDGRLVVERRGDRWVIVEPEELAGPMRCRMKSHTETRYLNGFADENGNPIVALLRTESHPPAHGQTFQITRDTTATIIAYDEADREIGRRTFHRRTVENIAKGAR